jgi:hypothetical protein
MLLGGLGDRVLIHPLVRGRSGRPAIPEKRGICAAPAPDIDFLPVLVPVAVGRAIKALTEGAFRKNY